jgi:prepilin-type N-terminal cleavage/methylation domain-containing protein
MKIRTSPANRAINQSGFTLIEMIGVLAVIAILAAVLIPKVF